MKGKAIPLPVKQAEMRERVAEGSSPQAPPSSATERHHTVKAVAAMWQISPDSVRRLFQDEPGVLGIGHDDSPTARRYKILRIPQSVLERVYRRHQHV